VKLATRPRMAGFWLNNDPSENTLRVKDGAPLVGRNSRPSQFRLDRPLRADRSAIAEGGFQPVSLPGKKRRPIWRPSTPVDKRLGEVVPFSMGGRYGRGSAARATPGSVFRDGGSTSWQPSKPRPRVTVAGAFKDEGCRTRPPYSFRWGRAPTASSLRSKSPLRRRHTGPRSWLRSEIPHGGIRGQPQTPWRWEFPAGVTLKG
jgi:hypothetical protein